MKFPRSPLLLSSLVLLLSVGVQAEEPVPVDERFPLLSAGKTQEGVVESVDFLHRRGQFRDPQTRALHDFTLAPYGAVYYRKAEADLRDVPLGTRFTFTTVPGPTAGSVRTVRMEDLFTHDARAQMWYRFEPTLSLEGWLRLLKHGPLEETGVRKEWAVKVDATTAIWKDGAAISVQELKKGDMILFNPGKFADWAVDQAAEIWVGEKAAASATEAQRKAFTEFTKFRGIAGWIDRTEGTKITLTLLGDPATFAADWKGGFEVGKDYSMAVANDELRTWNPPVDKERIKLLEISPAPTDRFGCSGVQLTVQVTNLLEGFRQGRFVRVFGIGWPIKDQPYGESLMGYGYGAMKCEEAAECTAKEYPEQYPYRTDYGNVHLPWFKLKPGEVPPPLAEHRAMGELVDVNPEQKSGRFRLERSGELVSFTLNPGGSVSYLNAKASLVDLPVGTRCRFHLFQDEQGAFTVAQSVMDEYSYLAANVLTYRVLAVHKEQHRLLVGRQLPEVKNYNGDMERPPDIGRSLLRILPGTRVWKGDQAVALEDLAPGQALLVNVSSEQPDKPSMVTDIWIGEDTHKLVTERQSKKTASTKK